MATVLITGAAGFIGSHTSIALLERFERVIGVDNLNDYYDPERKRANVRSVETAAEKSGNQFDFVYGDLRDKELIRDVTASSTIDVLVHLGAMAGVRVSIERPDLYYDVNVMGTLNLLTHARDRQIGNVVFASTSSVYGRSDVTPFEETQPCDRPLSPYAASKRAAEMLCHTYHHLYGLNITALRFFTVYGPRGRPDMMAYKVLSNIFHGDEVPIYNGGRMHRDWTYIDDIVSGVVAAAERPLGFEIVNLGRGEPVLLSDFVGLIEEASGKKATLVDAPMPSADVPFTFASIEKAKRLLDYEPKTSVREGVGNLWSWYESDILKHA